MEDKSQVIFGNKISEKDYKKALKSKKKYVKKFGDDSDVNYPIRIRKNRVLGDVFDLYDVLILPCAMLRSFLPIILRLIGATMSVKSSPSR